MDYTSELRRTMRNRNQPIAEVLSLAIRAVGSAHVRKASTTALSVRDAATKTKIWKADPEEIMTGHDGVLRRASLINLGVVGTSEKLSMKTVVETVLPGDVV